VNVPQSCSVCTREERGEINAAMMTKTPLRRIAERYGTSAATLVRHRPHIPSGLAIIARQAEEAEAETLASKVRRLETDARRLQAAAEGQGDIRAALAAIKVLSELVGLWERAALAARDGAQRDPKPTLTDGELVGAIEALLGAAAARQEKAHVC